MPTSGRALLGGTIALGLVAGQAGSAHAAEFDLPPFTSAYEPTTVDERGMWMEADERERLMQKSPLLVRDEELNAFVKRVLCDTVGTERCKGVRIYILELPSFNATMYANGLMTVWTGLLLRMRSEAELGAVLGHEFGHFENRHSLFGFKHARKSTDFTAWLQVLGGLTNTDTSNAQTSIIGGIYRYQREQEEEADLAGLRYLAASDYPSTAAAKVWLRLMEEQDATFAGRKRKKKHQYSAGFFDSHPSELKRATYLADEALKIGDTGQDPKSESYFAAMQSHLPHMLDTQIKLNDFGGTDFLIQDIAAYTGWTADLLYARGLMHQTRGNPRDLASAAEFYKEAIAAGYAGPEVHRNLGLALLRNGSRSEAIPALKTYLDLHPDAQDFGVIQALVPLEEREASGARTPKQPAEGATSAEDSSTLIPAREEGEH